MYAIIKTGGKQYWVIPGEVLHVDKLKTDEGKDIVFNALWSASSDEKQNAGNKNAKVVATVLRHLRGPKVIVFKRKPKKAYEKSRGHRQELSEIKIKEVQLS